MGVPKFFRYISERYPCLSELVKDYQIPEFDNLYLDMNGIIHMCSHPDDNDPHFRITEEKIFSDIFHYIEVLFRMIKPQKLFFMAVDGVAPRAKMNQQRGRRFRTAKEAEKLEQKAKEKGEVMPDGNRFDSNCITPGTVFMANLHEQLKYFVVNKISTDPMWTSCKIILSGHETPGEGEHKIMDYIRYQRSQPGYDPNTRHCLYGLDADLIMLGLCTHEPHFSLLREEVKFGKKDSKKRTNVPEQITFFLLHLSLMREYLEQEFISLKDELSFGYNIESIIDDWVLMGFLVGNDFIPHLPNLHIANGALPILYKAYIKVLPTFDGYINEEGKLNLERFEKFMEALCCIDIEQFSEQYADLKYFESKTGRRPNEKERTSYKPKKLEEWLPEGDDQVVIEALEREEATKPPMKADLAALVKATDMFMEPEMRLTDDAEDVDKEDISDLPESDSDEDDLLHGEFQSHKNDYYMHKLQYAQVTPEVMRAQAEGYVRAIQWNLHYYYNGVCSWSWYYEHHYAPFISDIKNFKDFRIDFDLGMPFKPYEQLLGVLPTASKKHLPSCYHRLMEDPSSPIYDYYPVEFNTDLNGKKQDWEAVVVIPFIDEKRLLAAMVTVQDELTPEEVKRNAHGPMLIYEYTDDDLGEYKAPEFFPNIKNNHAVCLAVTNEDVRVPIDKLIKGAYPGALFDVYYPGFPTTKHLKYKSFLKKAGVKVFEQPSRGENMILELEEKPVPLNPLTFAQELLGKTVFVLWPHLVEALVMSVSTKDYRYNCGNIPGEPAVEENKGNVKQNWQIEKNGIIEYYYEKRGVDVGDTEVLVHCRQMIGRKYVFSQQGRINLEKQWSDTTNAYPYQVIVQNISTYSPIYKPYHNIEDIFTIGSTCFMLGLPHYGQIGIVEDSKESLKKGRMKVSLKVAEVEPDFKPILDMADSLRNRYMPAHIAAPYLNISKRFFSRITGAIFVIMGGKREGIDEDAPRQNIGLNLKFNKRNVEIPGYTKKAYTWMYSEKALDLVTEYQQMFPEVYKQLEKGSNSDNYYEYELFPQDNGSGESVRKIVNWLKNQPYTSVEKQPCGNYLEPDVVKELEKTLDNYYENEPEMKSVVMQVKPNLLYKPGLLMGNVAPDPKATNFQLYDRVVNIRESYTVPLGAVGTIIAILQNTTDLIYDVLFDKPFAGGLQLNCSPNRGYKMSHLSLINRSHGVRQLEAKTGKPGQLMQRIGYTPSPFGFKQQPKQSFHQQNQNSAFASWGQGQNSNPGSPQHSHGSRSQGNGNTQWSNGRMPTNGKNEKKKPALQQESKVDFMPGFNKKQQQQQQAAVVTPPVENIKILERPSPASQAPPLAAAAPPTTGSNSSGISLTANDLIAHVSKQMQKMNMTPAKPPAPNLQFPTPAPISTTGPTIPSSFGIQLLHEYQFRGFGCPLYQYFFDLNTQTYQAQMKIPLTNETVFGNPAPTKEDASESVAEVVLKKLHPPTAATIPQFPAPPMQWCMPNNSPPRPPNPQESQHVAASLQQQQLQFQQQMQKLQQVSQIQQLQQMHHQQQGNRMQQQQQQAPRFPMVMQPPRHPQPPSQAQQQLVAQQQALMQQRMPFVPLQAVKQQRVHRTIYSNSNTQQGSRKNSGKGAELEDKVEGEHSQHQQQQAKKGDGAKNSGEVKKPRRERKIRIAANFSVKP